jgi:membrane protein DedA with SNARE-associated domain
MEMNFLEALGAFGFSGIKLLFTPMGYVIANEFPLLEIAIICGLGACFSAIIFFFVGKALDNAGQKKQNKKEKKVAFKRNRKIIRIKDKFKLFGVSMTIGIISVPIGSILVGKYFGKDKKAIPTLIGASFIWSFGVTYITALIYNVLRPIFS